MRVGWILTALSLTSAQAAAVVPMAVAPHNLQKIADDQQFRRWAAIKNPSPGDPSALGSYSGGCLAGAVAVAKDGPGYALMRLSRRRFYAHPLMPAYLENLSGRARGQGLPLILVGDISPPRGGPMRSGHNSHQTGLDVDIWLRLSSVRPNARQRESWSAPSVVSGRKKLTRGWGEHQAKLVALAADAPETARVFVSPPIKRYFCENDPEAKWLHKLRAWWGHEEHIHVRLRCPPDAADCMKQPTLDPADNGCGAELEWWFGPDADEEWQKIRADKSPRPFPELPAACEDLLR